VIEKHRIYHNKYFLTLIFTSISLTSLGIFSHNAYADTVIATIPMSSSAGESTVNPNTNMIYVQGYGNGWIAVINGSTNSVVSEISLTSDQAGYPLGIAANPDTNKIYADDGKGLEVIDGTSNSIIATIPITCSGDVAVNLNTNEVYVSDHFGNSVCVVDASTNTQVGTIGVGAQPWGIGVNTNTNKIYVTSEGGYDARQAGVAVIDGSTNSVVRTIPLSSYGSQVGVNLNTNKIYATAGQETYVINGITDTAVQIPLALGSIGANPNTNKIYATDGNAVDQIDIINGTTDAMTSTVQISSSFSPYLVVNPVTDRTYVSVASPPSVIVISDNSSATTSLPIKLMVNAQDVLGNPISGIWMELHSSNGDTIATGYTPITFDVKQGTQYVVYASNYLNYVFLHWDDGSFKHYRNITPAGNETLTATYTP